MNNPFSALISVESLMSLHRFYWRVKSQPHGCLRFPNVEERIPRLEKELLNKITVDQLWDLEKVLLDNNIEYA
jgi:hypothetical protein